MSAAAGSVPVEQVLPLVLAVVPLQEDPSENEPVYSVLCQLLDARAPAVVVQLPQIVVKFAQALMQPDAFLSAEIKGEIAPRVVAAVAQLKAAGGLAQVIAHLAPPQVKKNVIIPRRQSAKMAFRDGLPPQARRGGADLPGADFPGAAGEGKGKKRTASKSAVF